MSRGIERSVVPPIVLSGMLKAAKSWNTLHGTWASQAPEYWFTVTVAQELQRKLDDAKKWIRLEGAVKTTMRQSGSAGPGRPSTGLRRNGKCDIIVERLNELPFAAIEIKTRVYAFTSTLERDVIRLRDMLKKQHKNSISVACLAIYSDASEERTLNGARSYLSMRFEKNLERVVEICAGQALSVSEDHRLRKDSDSDDMWGVQCLALVRR